MDSLQEGCQVISFEWKYLYVNDALERQGQLPRDQLFGRTMMEAYPGVENAPFFSVLRRCMETRTRDRVEISFQFPDGSTGWFDLRIVPVPDGICIISLDTTQSRHAAEKLEKTEEQLRQSQKMEAIGVLAGGIAHDFNNLLSVVLSYSDILLATLDGRDAMRQEIEEIRKAGARAADLTRRLLMFSRQQVMEPKVLVLNDVLVSMDTMLQRILGADIDLVTLPAPSLGPVRVDRGSIEQVIMNLVVNARDAMPKGGKLTMETSDVVLDEDSAKQNLGLSAGRYVMLAVTDTGLGMDKALKERIFEPFFTTKEKGKGTGLGLSMVFGIVQQSGGGIWFYSEVGRGTTFKIYLPRVEDVAAPPRMYEAPASFRGNETILLVEDDDQVRLLACTILRRSGYNVLEARNAGEALLHAEQCRGMIHLLLSDVVMPQMSGPELSNRLRAARPDMQILWMSGYTDDSIVRHGVLEAKVAYLQKPITVESLTAKVRAVLG
ncbi:MAG TPA: ATP-binding protein [Polyangiaceae bacterium]|nr:ATP-binding protein [Polyangiaceae bacterium]